MMKDREKRREEQSRAEKRNREFIHYQMFDQRGEPGGMKTKTEKLE